MAEKAPFIIFKGRTGQDISDVVKESGRPYNLTGASVKFRMRDASSDDSSLKVDTAAVIDVAVDGEVSYGWSTGDLDTPGEYYGWWHVVLQDTSTLDTDEFLIVVTDHAPGVRTSTGSIFRKTRAILPITWDSLEDSERYGDSILQEKIEVAKLSILGASVSVAAEASYDIRVQDFIAKVVAISVIPAGVDYWMSQHQVLSATGTNESVSYPNRVDALWKLHERLVIEINEDRNLIDELLNVTSVAPTSDVPATSGGTDVGFKTKVASDNFRDYAFDENTSNPLFPN